MDFIGDQTENADVDGGSLQLEWRGNQHEGPFTHDIHDAKLGDIVIEHVKVRNWMKLPHINFVSLAMINFVDLAAPHLAAPTTAIASSADADAILQALGLYPCLLVEP